MSMRLLPLVLMTIVATLGGCGSNGDSRSSKGTEQKETTPAATENAGDVDPAQLAYIEEFGTAFADELTEPGSIEHEEFLECFATESKGMTSVPKSDWPSLANELSAPCRQALTQHAGPIE